MAMPRIGAPRPFETSARIFGVVEVGRRLDDRVRHPGRILALEDPRADEDALRAELHDERRVGRGRDAAGDEVDDRQPAVGGDLPDELVRRLELLGRDEELVLAHALEAPDLGEHVAQLADGLDDVAGARPRPSSASSRRPR